jgi:hypothetical protein
MVFPQVQVALRDGITVAWPASIRVTRAPFCARGHAATTKAVPSSRTLGGPGASVGVAPTDAD